MATSTDDNQSAFARSAARATEAHRQRLLFDAIAGVVGPGEARRMFDEIENIPYPGEGPEDVETERERFLRGVEDSSWHGVPEEYWPPDYRPEEDFEP